VEGLGRGAMGVVFRGFDPAIGRLVAIKIIKADPLASLEESAQLKLRFAREATAAGKLSHPNIVTVYQFGEEGDLQYLVLELVDGYSLDKTLSNGQPEDPKTVISLLTQVADALDYAHSKGIIHRERLQRGKLPVSDITWNEAKSYCDTVGMRLPTEAEWEYAARAGSSGSRYGDLDRVAWYNGNSGGKDARSGREAGKRVGLVRHVGEVWEWVWDWSALHYEPGDATDPQGPATGTERTVRGGGWYWGPAFARASQREGDGPASQRNDVGVRCAGKFPFMFFFGQRPARDQLSAGRQAKAPVPPSPLAIR
jgi:hypothetical protein